jgi:hypothetical protein
VDTGTVDGLPVDEAIREELRPRVEALGTDGWGDSVAVRFDTEDADAGRAYGCLLEFRGRRSAAASHRQ